jgi:osmotically-inducible protein OsmY
MAIYYIEFPDAVSSPDDIRLAVRVAEQLENQLPNRGRRIVVEVQNRIVILRGEAPSAQFFHLASQIVWMTPGVADLSNQLIVQPPP